MPGLPGIQLTVTVMMPTIWQRSIILAWQRVNTAARARWVGKAEAALSAHRRLREHPPLPLLTW